MVVMWVRGGLGVDGALVSSWIESGRWDVIRSLI